MSTSTASCLEPRAVDFSSGFRPLAQWFRSIGLSLKANAAGDDFTVPTAALADWILRADRWYRATSGLARGQHLHLTYKRDCSVFGIGILPLSSRILEIGEAAARCGITFGLSIRIDEVLRHPDQFQDILGARTARFVSLVAVPGATDHITPAEGQEIVQRVVDAGLRLLYLGPYEFFRSRGLMDLEGVNSSGVTMSPNEFSPPEKRASPPNPPRACFERFRLFVTPDGSIYPCNGLTQVEAAKLGTIFDPIEETVLGGRPTILDLATLAESGPELADPWPTDRKTRLPWICELHLRELAARGIRRDSPDPAVVDPIELRPDPAE